MVSSSYPSFFPMVSDTAIWKQGAFLNKWVNERTCPQGENEAATLMCCFSTDNFTVFSQSIDLYHGVLGLCLLKYHQTQLVVLPYTFKKRNTQNNRKYLKMGFSESEFVSIEASQPLELSDPRRDSCGKIQLISTYICQVLPLCDL